MGTFIIRRYFLVLVLVLMAVGQPAHSAELDAASPEELIRVLKANVYLSGDIVKRLGAQKRLERLGRQNPQTVVPLIINELVPPRSYGKMAEHQRQALVELLRDIGPAAEAAIPVLSGILKDSQESYESVKSTAAAALMGIGTVDAKNAAQAYFSELQRQSARRTTPSRATRSVLQSAYLIRQQLRSRRPSDDVISASVDGLAAQGLRAAAVLPTLLRAYSDPRLGTKVHGDIADAIRGAGIRNVEAAANEAAAERRVPDILSDVIGETRHPDSFVRGLAMMELGRLGPSEPAIDALIESLRNNQNPGDAARILGNFGKPAARALPHILRFFDTNRSGANAIQAAGKIGVKDPAIVTALRRVLANPNHRHRGMAASALGNLRATEALAELQQALAKGRKYDRILSANALARLGPRAAPAIGALTKILNQPDLDIRRAAVNALGRIGAAAAPAAGAISEQLNSGDDRLKRAARRALAKVGGAQADTALQRDAERFADADLAEVRRLARTHGLDGLSKYLRHLPDLRAVALARRMLVERHADIAYAGAWVLARRGEIEPAIPILVENLARRPEGKKMLTGLAYAMAHGGDATKIQSLIKGLQRYIEKNRGLYTPEEKARLDSLFKPDVNRRRR